MFQLFYPGREMILDSPLGVEELTRRLELAFEGTLADGRFCMMRKRSHRRNPS